MGIDSSLQEYRAAMSVYVRTAEGERIDTRDDTARRLAEMTDGSALSIMDCGDLAAILSNGVVSINERALVELRGSMRNPKKLQAAVRQRGLEDIFTLKKNHPANRVFNLLLETPDGAVSVVCIASILAIALTDSKESKKPTEKEQKDEADQDNEQGSLFDQRSDS